MQRRKTLKDTRWPCGHAADTSRSRTDTAEIRNEDSALHLRWRKSASGQLVPHPAAFCRRRASMAFAEQIEGSMFLRANEEANHDFDRARQRTCDRDQQFLLPT